MDLLASIDFGSTLKLFMEGGSFVCIVGLVLFVWKALPKMIDRIVDGKVAKQEKDHKVLADVYAMLTGLKEQVEVVTKRVTHHVGTSDHISLRKSAQKANKQIDDLHKGCVQGETWGVWDKLNDLGAFLQLLMEKVEQLPDQKRFDKLAGTVKRQGRFAGKLKVDMDGLRTMVEGIPNRVVSLTPKPAAVVPTNHTEPRLKLIREVLNEAWMMKNEQRRFIASGHDLTLTMHGVDVTLSKDSVKVEARI